MSKQATYILLFPYWDTDDYGDHRPNPSWEDVIHFYKDDKFDVNKVVKEHGIKHWAPYDSDPADYDSWANKEKHNTAMLLEVRPFNIKPIKVVTNWGISRIVNEN